MLQCSANACASYFIRYTLYVIAYTLQCSANACASYFIRYTLYVITITLLRSSVARTPLIFYAIRYTSYLIPRPPTLYFILYTPHRSANTLVKLIARALIVVATLPKV